MLFDNFIKPHKIGKTHNKGEIIYLQNDSGNSLYNINSGGVALIVQTVTRTVRICLLKQHDIFGIPHLFGREKRCCTAVVTEDNTNLIKLDKQLILAKMHTDPSFMYNISKMLNDRFMDIIDECPCECDDLGECKS